MRTNHNLPIPGTERAARGLFLGRWGALLERPEEGVCKSFDDALLLPRTGELLFRAAQQRWRIYLIGNEDAVAKGRMSDAAWEAFQAALHAHVKGLGIPIARDYACLDRPDGKGRHKRDSVFLFPNTGALYHAAQEDGIELAESWLISDEVNELAAGWRASLHVAALGSSRRVGLEKLEVECDLRAESLAEALATLLAAEPLRTV